MSSFAFSQILSMAPSRRFVSYSSMGASGAILALVSYSAFNFPGSKVHFLFLPEYSISVFDLFLLMAAVDVIGIFFNLQPNPLFFAPPFFSLSSSLHSTLHLHPLSFNKHPFHLPKEF